MASQPNVSDNEDDLLPHIKTLISALHILHHNSVLDAYGHISFRHPTDPSLFLMPRNLAPALVSSPSTDIVTYHISDATPVNPSTAPRGYIERQIHAALYRQYSHITSVVHAHAESVVLFSILPPGSFRPVCHMSGFLGASTPVFDLAPFYGEGEDEQQDLLIKTSEHGDALAHHFSLPPSPTPKDRPDHSVVLMRGHGFTVAAESIEKAVYQAHYTLTNARILNGALAASSGLAISGGAAGHPETRSGLVHYLSDREARDTWKGNEPSVGRPWGLWKREVEEKGTVAGGGLYRNDGDEEERN